mgnify:CR=1 FL=1
MIVLGIETSCDETGVAVYDTARGLRSHTLYSQIRLHADYGGVVPELASRDHVRKLVPLARECLAQAGLGLSDLDGVAYTAGPGLVGALLVGAAFGRALAFALEVPAIGVHHMEGHLLAPLLEENAPQPPFVALLVSGGHSQLVDVRGIGDYALLGETLDDAAGEAFDKTAKLMGLPYPGGPHLAKLAQQGLDMDVRATQPQRLAELAERRRVQVCFPRLEFCTDNGAMIAFAGALRLAAGEREPAAIRARPRWDMAQLAPI